MTIRRSLIYFGLSSCLAAQEPIPILRQPPINPTVKSVRAPSRADFQQAAALLNQQPKKGSRRTLSPTITGTIEVPGDRTIVLPDSAIQAIQLEANWRNRQSAPMIGDDGRIIYVYGHGQPNIPVAPGKICTIEFEPGETLDESGMELGDTVNWKWSKHQVMRADKLVSYLTLSPKYSGLDTPMTVFTNLRAYYFRLLSDTTGYIERVGFTYPDDDVKRKQEAERAAKAQEEAARIAAEKAQRDAEELRAKNTDGPIKNTDYSVQVGKKAAYFRPVLIGDNGAHTKIQLPESCRHRDLPTLTLQNHLGTEAQPFAFDEKTLTYTVNGLFDAAELSVGVGKNKISIRIVNNSLKG